MHFVDLYETALDMEKRITMTSEEEEDTSIFSKRKKKTLTRWSPPPNITHCEIDEESDESVCLDENVYFELKENNLDVNFDAILNPNNSSEQHIEELSMTPPIVQSSSLANTAVTLTEGKKLFLYF